MFFDRLIGMAKLKLDLHDIYNDSRALEAELNRILAEAARKKISLVEIIPGKGSGQLKGNGRPLQIPTSCSQSPN